MQTLFVPPQMQQACCCSAEKAQTHAGKRGVPARNQPEPVLRAGVLDWAHHARPATGFDVRTGARAKVRTQMRCQTASESGGLVMGVARTPASGTTG